MRDWLDPAAYAFTAGLSPQQWAWEFLRRNTEYRRQWQAFWDTWQALEAVYGSPPNRDFNAWKQDPRAWVPAAECGDGECRVDRDKVLIECALGARWGFYKFPPDPAENDVVGRGLLVWREPERSAPALLDPEDADYLGSDPEKVALGFDLALPLREQLDQAKRLLQVLQRQRRLQPRSAASQRARWTLYLRLLDAEAAGAAPEVMAEVCAPDGLESNLGAARDLAGGGYRRILLLPH